MLTTDVEDSEVKHTIDIAQEAPTICKNESIVRKLILNTYKTLLTRGQKGCYVYCEDKSLVEYIKKKARLVQCEYYDYMSDNLADDFGALIRRNTLILRRLRQILTIRIPARLYIFSQDLAVTIYRNMLVFSVIRHLPPARLSEISARNVASERINIVKR